MPYTKEPRTSAECNSHGFAQQLHCCPAKLNLNVALFQELVAQFPEIDGSDITVDPESETGGRREQGLYNQWVCDSSTSDDLRTSQLEQQDQRQQQEQQQVHRQQQERHRAPAEEVRPQGALSTNVMARTAVEGEVQTKDEASNERHVHFGASEEVCEVRRRYGCRHVSQPCMRRTFTMLPCAFAGTVQGVLRSTPFGNHCMKPVTSFLAGI